MNGRKSDLIMKLVGECSLCGQCCVTRAGGVQYRCENLTGGGRCAVYDQRVDLMPITLISSEGETLAARCGAGDSAREQASILRVIERGECSFRVGV